MAPSEATGRIQIIRTPDGEAPEWVRQAWVGLELACYPRGTCTIDCATGKHDLRGAVSGKQLPARGGYRVPIANALEALWQKNSKAAAWWESQGYPRSGVDFLFESSCAEEVSGMQPMILVDDMETGRFEAPGDR